MRAFLFDYGLGVTLLVITYVFATALRDFRDNFGAELWTSLGYSNPAAVFTSTEIPVGQVALVRDGNHRQGSEQCTRSRSHSRMILAGLLLLGASTMAFDAGWLGPLPWMIASGAGLYVIYTPFNAMLFDRLVAVSGRVATAGFLIYVADAAGYAGSFALLLWRNFALLQVQWLAVFRVAIYATTLVGVVLVSLSLVYFNSRARAAAVTLATSSP